MNAAEHATFFDEVVAASGLTPLIAPFTVTRLLVRANATPRSLDRDHLRRALPEFEKGLAVYLDEAKVAAAMQRLRALANAG
ncbi:MAG TPA: hypothetical protein VNI55_07970 [Gaiellaceae bacterium]|nr:hypothetical protein [Gaiellaceae bacterium]